MHSSRMRTTRLLPVYPSMHCSRMWTEFLTHASENITLPQLRCGRKKLVAVILFATENDLKKNSPLWLKSSHIVDPDSCRNLHHDVVFHFSLITRHHTQHTMVPLVTSWTTVNIWLKQVIFFSMISMFKCLAVKGNCWLKADTPCNPNF